MKYVGGVNPPPVNNPNTTATMTTATATMTVSEFDTLLLKEAIARVKRAESSFNHGVGEAVIELVETISDFRKDPDHHREVLFSMVVCKKIKILGPNY